jgi:hypothetical protein
MTTAQAQQLELALHRAPALPETETAAANEKAAIERIYDAMHGAIEALAVWRDAIGNADSVLRDPEQRGAYRRLFAIAVGLHSSIDETLEEMRDDA